MTYRAKCTGRRNRTWLVPRPTSLGDAYGFVPAWTLMPSAQVARRAKVRRSHVDFDAGPYVCPGCYAIGEEPCAPGCIDDEMRHKVFDDDDYEMVEVGVDWARDDDDFDRELSSDD